jgi:hydrogenase nickel incorporation protein HypB
VHRTAVKKVVLEGVLDANDALAQANREKFDEAGTYVINLMSSPGAGKTSLLEHTLERMRGKLRLGVLEGDVQTTLDADRLARFHVPLVQVNTDPGFGGECHLDANMVRSGLSELPLGEMDILVIENVGNLVCPAEFRVGEDARVMVYSVTEGEEKPLKYPLMFRSADLVVVNKVDLLEHLDFDLEQFLGHLDTVNPGVERILASARTGQGVDELCSWLERRRGPSR